ncbi:hypothetical protein B9T29_07450 [Acinetobacter sp. ANC 3903]|uniref:hypothetical protein n=1 Tax=Acinetobacter sp. ANC 3903 TaxID=1977883 RepID=UPI000A3536EB|nr:hypothetical protein [Acinetobacter sp. ANC 3903]OTG62601.1 hypothetical protein B9T29_07450 [Acinetobacter sp. ANC 3903]
MFLVPSVDMINLDNIVDHNQQHLNFHINSIVNLTQVLSFHMFQVASQQFTKIPSDMGVRYGIQFFMINSSIVFWYFSNKVERDDQLNTIIQKVQ